MRMKRVVDRLVAAYWGHVDRVIDAGRVDPLAVVVARAETVVRAYFAFVFFLGFVWSRQAVERWVANASLEPKLGLALPHVIPVEHWPQASVVTALVVVFGSLLASWQPHLRWPRLVTVAGCVLHWAIGYDVAGKVDHGLHPTLWAGIALCFLPAGRPSQEAECRDYLGAFWGSQVMVGLLYTCAGLCKLLGVVFDWSGGVTWFHPDALPLTLANNWDRSQSMLLTRFLIANPGVSALLNLGVAYLEFATVFAVLRPRLHQLWALGLLLMHLAILHSMMINFHQSCFILLLFLLGSPFRPEWQWRETWRCLPLVHGAITLFERFRGAGRPGGRTPEPHRPRSWVLRVWLPWLVPVYLLVSFSRLDWRRGEFQTDLFPTSALYMFWRIDNTPENVQRLKEIRAEIEETGHWWPQKSPASSKPPAQAVPERS